MRLLAICEAPPTLDPRYGDGLTLVSAQLLMRLPRSFEIDVVYFADRPAGVPHALDERCRSVTALPLAPEFFGYPTRLPKGARLRWTPKARELVSSLARRANVVYLHGLDTFTFARSVVAPVVAHEVDPRSLLWRERARRARGLQRVNDRLEAGRALALERATAGSVARYLLVGDADAVELSALLGRQVTALPNGVDRDHLSESSRGRSDGDPALFGSVGTLDHPPNVEAVLTLAREVLPRVRRALPEARLLIAGRRPVPQILGLAGQQVEVAADLRDITLAYERPSVLVYPGTYARGWRNTIAEALAVGRPVVASSSAARGIGRGDHIVIADDPESIASEVARLLADPAARRRMREAALAYTASLPTWDDVARRFGALLSEVSL